MSCLVSDPDRFRGRRVVVTDDAFPSVLQPARVWSTPSGYTLDVVEPDAVLDAVDETCGLLVLNHVGFTTGARLDDATLAEAAQAAHRHRALLAVDGFHAVGTMPVDAAGLGIDVYAGGLLKEGSGSSGTAFVYVRPELELMPRLTGWFGHADPFEFEPEPQPARDARNRFLGGTTAIAPLYHAVEGVRILLETGLDRDRADSLRKTERCLERAGAAGMRLRSPRDADRRSAMVIFEVDHADLLSSHLKALGVFTDSRLGCYLRMAPFIWNTDAELERAWDVIEEVMRTRSHLETTPRPPDLVP